MTESAYYSDHPDVIAKLNEYDMERIAFWETTAAFAAKVGDGNWKPLRLRAHKSFVAGLEPREAFDPGPPWHLIVRRGYMMWVPHKGRRGGRALSAEMEAFELLDIQSRLLGMPDQAWVPAKDSQLGSYRIFYPQIWPVGADVQGVACEAVWVWWQIDPSESSKSMRFGEVDPALWRRAKLSEYYIWRESVEDDEPADGD